MHRDGGIETEEPKLSKMNCVAPRSRMSHKRLQETSLGYRVDLLYVYTNAILLFGQPSSPSFPCQKDLPRLTFTLSTASSEDYDLEWLDILPGFDSTAKVREEALEQKIVRDIVSRFSLSV
jgi:hypothetical protein